MANFNVHLKFCQTNSAEFIMWFNKRCIPYWYKISKWYDETLLCCHQVKICDFTNILRTNKESVNWSMFSPACKPHAAVPRWVDERINQFTCLKNCRWRPVQTSPKIVFALVIPGHLLNHQLTDESNHHCVNSLPTDSMLLLGLYSLRRRCLTGIGIPMAL